MRVVAFVRVSVLRAKIDPTSPRVEIFDSLDTTEHCKTYKINNIVDNRLM